MSASARRLLVAVVVVLTVVVGAVWLIDRPGEDPPVVTLTCLDAVHRPVLDRPGQNSLVVGVQYDGPFPGYEVAMTVDGVTSRVSAPGVTPIPVERSTVSITAVEVLTPTDGDDADRIDVTEQALGGPSRDVALPDSDGPVDPTQDPCDESLPISSGYPFAAPSPPFGAETSVEPALVEEAAALVGALNTADPEVAMGLLHPVSIDGYGEEICRAHVQASVPEMPPLDVQAVSAVSGHRFQRPGGEDLLDDVVLVEVEANGVPWRFNLARHEGELRWLSWCGN